MKQHRGQARRSARVVKLRLVQKVKRNHVAFLSDVDEQEVEHKLELVHEEQLRVKRNQGQRRAPATFGGWVPFPPSCVVVHA